ncbi:MAG: hypothetical protein KAH32_06245 [Chlamydiia bacterium]|nr:hypothetical protein [Chlamydiia bacterium]
MNKYLYALFIYIGIFSNVSADSYKFFAGGDYGLFYINNFRSERLISGLQSHFKCGLFLNDSNLLILEGYSRDSNEKEGSGNINSIDAAAMMSKTLQEQEIITRMAFECHKDSHSSLLLGIMVNHLYVKNIFDDMESGRKIYKIFGNVRFVGIMISGVSTVLSNQFMIDLDAGLELNGSSKYNVISDSLVVDEEKTHDFGYYLKGGLRTKWPLSILSNSGFYCVFMTDVGVSSARIYENANVNLKYVIMNKFLGVNNALGNIWEYGESLMSYLSGYASIGFEITS